MSDTELEQAEARLQDYRNAEARIVAGLGAELNGRRLSLSDLGEVQFGIELWSQRVQIARIQARRRGAQGERDPCSAIDEGMNGGRQRLDESPL